MLEADRPAAAVQVLDDVPGDERGDDPDRDDDLDGLLAFRRLDLLLAAGVEGARRRYGPEAASDSYRGFYLTEEQVQRALRRRVAEPLLAARPVPPLLPAWDRIAADNLRWAWLRDRYDLTELELDVVLIAVGPDVDRRYEQLYGSRAYLSKAQAEPVRKLVAELRRRHDVRDRRPVRLEPLPPPIQLALTF